MLIADSHEFIELWRGVRDLRMGMEYVKARPDVRFVSLAPDILSPADRALRPGATRLSDVGLPALPERMEVRTVPGHVVRFARKEGGGRFVLMRGYGRALASVRPDVITENPFVWLTPRNYATHRVAKRLGVPFVYYDPGDDVAMTRQQRAVVGFERPVVNDAFAIITFTAAGRRRFVTKYGYPAERVRVIPKPVDVEVWRPDISPQEARERLGLPPAAFVVAYVGRLARMKGSRVLADVARRASADPSLSHWRFLFAGGVLDSLEDAADYDLPNALVTGMLPNEELPAAIAAADVVAFPDVAHPGGFWSSVAEAMASAKPIVIGAPPDQDFLPIVDGENGLVVPPSDAEALFEALKRLEASEALRDALGSAVGRFAEERMDYARVATAWLDVLDEAVAGNTSRHLRSNPFGADEKGDGTRRFGSAGIQSMEGAGRPAPGDSDRSAPTG